MVIIQVVYVHILYNMIVLNEYDQIIKLILDDSTGVEDRFMIWMSSNYIRDNRWTQVIVFVLCISVHYNSN